MLAGDERSTSEGDIEKVIGERTAGIFFYAPGAPNVVPFERVLEIARRHRLAVIVDAAEQVYPLENFSWYVRAGADFATYSGKFFGAGSMAGILTGTAAGIAAARRNSYLAFEGPDAQAFGRHMKVGSRRDNGCLRSSQELAGDGPRPALPALPGGSWTTCGLASRRSRS